MESLKELVEYGKSLGLTGVELNSFIKEQQAIQREQRLEQRQKEKEEREYKLEIEKAKIEADHLLKENELKVREKERSIEEEKLKIKLKELEHGHKLEILDKETELKSKGLLSSQTSSGVTPKAPKMPCFDESRDDMDSYLRRFESYATAQQWSKDMWATNLSALLMGKALDVYALLPSEKALDYDELKSALLKRFKLTEDGFRQKFRNVKPEVGETYQQFSVRLQSYLNRWLEFSGNGNTYEGLFDIIMREQFLIACNRELTLFLKERLPKNIREMSKLADQFREARLSNSQLFHSQSLHRHGFPQNKNSSELNRRQDVSKTQDHDQSKQQKERRCYNCGKHGHIAQNCRFRGNFKHKVGSFMVDCETGDECDDNASFNETESQLRQDQNELGNTVPKTCSAVVSFHNTETHSQSNDLFTHILSTSCYTKMSVRNMPTANGLLGNEVVSVLRDTGCSGVVVRKRMVLDNQFTGKIQSCLLADGSKVEAPIAKVCIDTPYFSGTIEAWCLENPIYDVIIGNIKDARDPNDPDPRWQQIQAVQTRSQKQTQGKTYKPLKVPESIAGEVSPDEIKKAQEADQTLQRIRDIVREDSDGKTFFMKNGLIFRKFHASDRNEKTNKQLVIPQQYRHMVLRLAHESIMSGHLGIKRTCDKVLSEFYWPGAQADVKRYVQSCDICQRTMPKGKNERGLLGQMPLIEVPFERIAVDLVGPMEPRTNNGNKYVLTIVDYATRYPEAIPLPSIETERVAEALLDVFCRMGIPKEMLTDMGSQFTSNLMSEISHLISLKQLTTTPYHPMCNGLVERFNGTLKTMLKRLCSERPHDWDKYINPLLFAYRDAPQESLGFTPFELIYGRSVRGPMTILKELWTKEISDPQVKSTYQYVIDLRERLEKTCEVARQNLGKASNKYRKVYNRKAKNKRFKVGDKVLVLLPTNSNKLLMHWKGPYVVTEKVSNLDFRIQMGNKQKTFHVNMLKLYIDRNLQNETHITNNGVLGIVNVAVVDVQEDNVSTGELVGPPNVKRPEGWTDVNINSELRVEQVNTIKEVLRNFPDVLSDLPGKTTLGEHDIKLTTDEPIRTKQYPLPYTMREAVSNEVFKMLELGIIESSDSAYSSPVVLVIKKDGTNRFCIDFRSINRVTIFDAEPMPNPDEVFLNLSKCKFISKLDLAKGYWQIPLTETAKQITAFQTPHGLYQFTVLPFGLVNAPASFCRIMRKLLRGMENIDNFIDDILIFTESFEHHISTLTELLTRLHVTGLTAKPSKCFIAFKTVECLGHMAGNDRLQPLPDKVKAVQDAKRPETKKQVKSFIGLVGFYRKFIPNFASIASPLTDLTKKGQPNRVVWGPSQENAFQSLKNALIVSPILKLPDMNQAFILQTDASDNGIGAVLLQEELGMKMPVSYASRKLQKGEIAFATIEKECLAIVWAIQKFQRYLYGKEFILETDHQPLIYLNKTKVANARLMRWSLLLQPYRYRIVAIKSSENVVADCLSRL